MDLLRQITDSKAAEVAQLRAGGALPGRVADAPRDLAAALAGARHVRLLAEVKRRSPSAGWIAEGADAVAVARAYESAGAAAISVLTDAPFFGGSLEDLRRVREAVAIPVLRKDFVIDELQIDEAWSAGADAVLLIVRVLNPARLRALLAAATERGLSALVEAHDGAEVAIAREAGAVVIGINSRDLATFATDLDAGLALGADLPRELVLVAESGIRGGNDMARVGAAGFDAALVGETLMRSASPAQAVRALLGQPRTPRPASSGAMAWM